MRITVIIPTYNYAKFLVEAIESIEPVKAQDDVEIIIVDDGSTDETRSIVNPWLDAAQVSFYYQENKGKTAATKKALDLASGEIIFNLDADDYFLPGKIIETIKLFQKFPNLVHVSSAAKIVFDDGRTPEVEKIPATWLDRPFNGAALLKDFFENKLLFGGGSTFAARASVLKSMQWDDAVDMYTDEWLLIETLLQGDSYILSEPLSVWRVHGNNYSASPSPERQAQKRYRMEKSSQAILQLLEQGNYPDWLKKIYRLKHAVRRMVWLEEANQKTMADSWHFFRKIILGGYPVKVLQQYHAFNRLIPGWLQKALR